MSKKIKGLLINPEEQNITEVSIDSENILQSMYRCIDCDYVGVIPGKLRGLPSCPADDIWMDEEALLHVDKPLNSFCIMFPCDLIEIDGSALILGHDDNGDCVDHTLSAEDIEVLKRNTIFFD